MVRVKRGTPESTHIENRGPTAVSNPYLVGAALLSAGLAGIEEGLRPPEPSRGGPAEEDPSLEALPTSLPEALGELEGEPATKDFFGEEFLKAYTAMRRHELSRFADWVTDWEREEYLDLF